MDELQCPWCGVTFNTKEEADADYRKCNAQTIEYTEEDAFGFIHNPNNY